MAKRIFIFSALIFASVNLYFSGIDYEAVKHFLESENKENSVSPITKPSLQTRQSPIDKPGQREDVKTVRQNNTIPDQAPGDDSANEISQIADNMELEEENEESLIRDFDGSDLTEAELDEILGTLEPDSDEYIELDFELDELEFEEYSEEDIDASTTDGTMNDDLIAVQSPEESEDDLIEIPDVPELHADEANIKNVGNRSN